MTVSFYNFTGDDRVANKNLVLNTSVTCSVYDGCTVINPVLRLSYSSSIANNNYFYISDWGRYYKVTNVEVNDAKEMFISGTVDAVKSFWGEIKNCTGSVTRNEKVGVGDIIDQQLPINPSSESVKIEDAGLDLKRNMNYILTMK